MNIHGVGYYQEVLPARRRFRMLRSAVTAVCCSIALMAAAKQWAGCVAARPGLKIEQPWPCEYDRGVLAACRRPTVARQP